MAVGKRWLVSSLQDAQVGEPGLSPGMLTVPAHALEQELNLKQSVYASLWVCAFPLKFLCFPQTAVQKGSNPCLVTWSCLAAPLTGD